MSEKYHITFTKMRKILTTEAKGTDTWDITCRSLEHTDKVAAGNYVVASTKDIVEDAAAWESTYKLPVEITVQAALVRKAGWEAHA